MPQFDVHRNTGRQRDTIPYVVVVQSAWFDDYRRRIVVPLVKKSALGAIASARINPTFRVERLAVVLHPLEIVSVAVDQLGDKVGSLESEGEQIIAALDEVFSRAWG
jgi:toxin CcdB